jgi:prepilin-type N-terminal cleavage/methylation domain-containing protein
MIAASRKAFTLVELLVVTGLLASLLSLVIVATRPTEDAQIRQVANALTSAIMQTQTKALSRTEGAALAIFPSGTSVAFCEIDPPIIATSTTAIPPAAASPVIGFSALSNADTVADGYQIRFSAGGSYGPWFRFEPDKSRVSMRPDLGQNLASTVWPTLTSGSIGCEISRIPRASQSAVPLPKSVAIDTRFSGVGDEVDVEAKPSPLLFSVNALGGMYLHFDRTGVLSTIIPGNGGAPIKPIKPIYILVRAASQTAPLQSQTATWVTIFPGVSRVMTGKNVPQPIPDDSSLGKEELPEYYRRYYGRARSNIVPFVDPDYK